MYITQCMLGIFTSSITTLLSLATPVISEISCKISILNHSSKISQQQFAGNKFQKIDFQVPPFPSGPSHVTAWCRKTLKKSQQWTKKEVKSQYSEMTPNPNTSIGKPWILNQLLWLWNSNFSKYKLLVRKTMMMMINCVFLSFSSRQSWQLRKECSLTLPSPQHHEVRQMCKRRS